MNTQPSTVYYLYLNEQQSGPFAIEQLRAMWEQGTINSSTLYWFEGAADWQELSAIEGLLESEKKHSQAVTVVSKPTQLKTNGQSSNSSPPKKNILLRVLISGSVVVGTLVVIGLLFVFGSKMMLDSKKSEMRAKLASTIKSMTTISLATERGVNRSEFRQLVLTAKTEYEVLSTNQKTEVDELFHDAATEIDKAFLCWEAADFIWESQGKYEFGGNMPSTEYYGKLMGYITDCLGGDIYKKMEEALKKDKMEIGDIAFNKELQDPLISTFFSTAGSHASKAKSLVSE